MHLEVGDTRAGAFTMQEPPSTTFAHVLEDLYTVPGEFIGCLEWQRLGNDRVRRDLRRVAGIITTGASRW